MAPSLPRRPTRSRHCLDVPASDHRALQKQIRELHRLLGKKTIEAEILREALLHADPNEKTATWATDAARQFAVKAVASTLGVARSRLKPRPAPTRCRGRPPASEDEMLARIKAIVAALPTYGHRRVHALLRHQAEEEGRPSSNH